MAIRHHVKYREKLHRMPPTSAEDICAAIAQCEQNPALHTAGRIVRVTANTGIHNGELQSLKLSSVDVERAWLRIERMSQDRVESRQIPLRQRTLDAILALHTLNPDSEFVLGDHPRTRFEQTIRKLKLVAPQFGRSRLWMHSLRMSFAYRLLSAGIPHGMAKYLLGHTVIDDAFEDLQLNEAQKFQVLRRQVERFVQEL